MDIDKPIIVPLAKEPPSLTVRLTREESAELREVAIRHKTSPAALGRLAVRHLLTQVQRGAAPLIQPSTNETGIIPPGWEVEYEPITVISTGPTQPQG